MISRPASVRMFAAIGLALAVIAKAEPAAGHFARVNCGPEHTTRSCLEYVASARLIAAYGIAFFDRYLKGQPAPILDGPNPEVAEFLTK